MEHLHKLAKSCIDLAHKRVNKQIQIALNRAEKCLEKNIMYKLGSKSGEYLDCSGLIQKCYPNIKGNTEQQFDLCKKWIFKDEELIYYNVADIIFFNKINSSGIVSHVGIITGSESSNPLITHASESEGKVSQDIFHLKDNKFKDEYICKGIVKIKPFLFGAFIKDEIKQT